MEKYDIYKHGVTQSVLGTWLKCRERAKLSLQGYSGMGGASVALIYGELFHGVLERVFKMHQKGKMLKAPGPKRIHRLVKKVAKGIAKRFSGTNDYEYANLTYCKMVAEAQLPAYFKANAKDFSSRKWTFLEKEFCVPIKMPDGKTIPYRGKIDGAYEQDGQFKVFETKTKSRVDVDALVDQLHFDFQTSAYIFACISMGFPFPAGVLYNVIRRPELRQKKTESRGQFLERVKEDCNARRDHYYLRFHIVVDKKEMKEFVDEFKRIVTDFYLWYTGKLAHYRNTGACQDKYGSCSFLPVCARGEWRLLSKRDRIFPELGEIK